MCSSDLAERHEQRRHDIERPLLDPSEIFLTGEELEAALAARRRVDINTVKVEPIGAQIAGSGVQNFACELPPALRIDPRREEDAGALGVFLSHFSGRVLLVAESAGRREVLLEFLRRHDRVPKAVAGWQEFCQSEIGKSTRLNSSH